MMKTALTRHRLTAAAAIAAVAGIVMLYLLVDPAGSRWMPKCLFFSFTGLRCPGCGLQRMLHALLNGDLAAAWGYNPFLMLAAPAVAYMAWLETQRTRRPRLYARFYSPGTAAAVLIILVMWTAARNILGI